MDSDIDIRKAWIEASVEEFGRCLPGMIILVSHSETEDVKIMLEKLLNDTWEQAQKPLLEALKPKYVDESIYG